MDVNTDRLLNVAPHYIVMLILVFLIIGVVNAVVGDLGFWIEFAIIMVIVFAYRPVVMRLGLGPSEWE